MKNLIMGILIGLVAVMAINAIGAYYNAAKAEWAEMSRVHRCAAEQVAMGIERKDVHCPKPTTTRSKKNVE